MNPMKINLTNKTEMFVCVCETFVRFIEKSKTDRGISRSGKSCYIKMVVRLSIRHE